MTRYEIAWQLFLVLSGLLAGSALGWKVRRRLEESRRNGGR